MKQKTVWFLCALLWSIVTVFRIITTGTPLVIGYHIAASIVFWCLFTAQLFCDKRGESGRKLMRKIGIAALAAVIALTLTVISR